MCRRSGWMPAVSFAVFHTDDRSNRQPIVIAARTTAVDAPVSCGVISDRNAIAGDSAKPWFLELRECDAAQAAVVLEARGLTRLIRPKRLDNSKS